MYFSNHIVMDSKFYGNSREILDSDKQRIMASISILMKTANDHGALLPNLLPFSETNTSISIHIPYRRTPPRNEEFSIKQQLHSQAQPFPSLLSRQQFFPNESSCQSS